MKSEKGITVTSLVIYVMSFLAITVVIAMVTNFYYNNTKKLSSGATASSEYDMLNVYLLKEINHKENFVKDVNYIETNYQDEDGKTYTKEEKKIVFNTGNEYVFYKEKKEDKYGKIIFINKQENKYFILSNYIEDFSIFNIDNAILEGQDLLLKTFKIKVKILQKEYEQNYTIQ